MDDRNTEPLDAVERAVLRHSWTFFDAYERFRAVLCRFDARFVPKIRRFLLETGVKRWFFTVSDPSRRTCGSRTPRLSLKMVESMNIQGSWPFKAYLLSLESHPTAFVLAIQCV